MSPIQDYLSLLPDTLLLIILSLLPFKDAVRTSVLAKQWHNLWRLRPNIEINEGHFLPPCENDDHPDNVNDIQTRKQLRQTSCINFGRSWLLNQNSNYNMPTTISAFTLVFSNPFEYHLDMERFMHFALTRETKSLELDFSVPDWENRLPLTDTDTYTERFNLPQFVYHYESLESLKLVSCHFKDDCMRSLGRGLKSLSLGWIEITNPPTLTNILRSCPVLEDLSLFKCFGSTVYVIESRRLKRLVVEKCVDLLNLSVIASNLRSFKYCGGIVEFGMSEFRDLQEADLDFGFVGVLDEESGEVILQLLSHYFYFTTSLRVCSYITQVLPIALVDSLRLPGRARIKELKIKTSFHDNELFGMLCLLNSYPFMERLCFEVGQQTIFEQDYTTPINWSEIKPMANGCVRKTLKVVEIKGFRGSPNELQVISFLLGYGQQVLQTLILKVVENDRHAQRSAMALRSAILGQLAHLNVVIN